MTTKTYQEQLESVQTLIAQIEANPNASYTLLGRTFSRHDLSTLYAREQWLRSQAARESRGGRKVQRAIPA